MRNLFSTKVKIILVVAALLTAALAIYSGISNQSLPSVIVQGVLAPFRAAGCELLGDLENAKNAILAEVEAELDAPQEEA